MMRTSIVVGFAVVAQTPHLLSGVRGGAIKGGSYCETYNDDQVYTADSCGSYDSIACAAHCTNDADSWCNLLCGNGAETCMDGSGAVCAISALSDIVNTCERLSSATAAYSTADALQTLANEGPNAIAVSGAVAGGKEQSEGVASTGPDGAESGDARVEDTGAAKTVDGVGSRIHTQSCGKGCTETVYDDDDDVGPATSGERASEMNNGLEPGRRRLGGEKLGAPNYESYDHTSGEATDDQLANGNGHGVVVNAHGCDEHVFCSFCDATCQKVMSHYAKRLWGVKEWSKAYNRMGSGPMAMLLLNDLESLCDLVTANVTDFAITDVAVVEDVGVVGDGVAATVGTETAEGFSAHYVTYSVVFLASVGLVSLYVYVRRARNVKAAVPVAEPKVSYNGVAVDPSRTWAVAAARKASQKQEAYGAI